MTARQCWTCNTEHDLDTACPQSSMARSARAAGGVDPFTSPSQATLPVAFEATYASDCSCCWDGIEPGEMIRADENGEWEHTKHAD